GVETTGTTTGGLMCGDEICPGNFICEYDTCIPDLGPCQDYDDCPGDSYCDENGKCIPYGVPMDKFNDPTCQKEDLPDGVTPVVQCEWTGPNDPNDPTNNSHYIYTTPIVADLNLDDDTKKLQPSVVVTTWQTVGGVGRVGTLRVFDGRTCEEQMRLGGADENNTDDRPGYGSQWAVADLNGDVGNNGHPEIVGLHRNDNNTASLYALEIDNSDLNNPQLQRLWYGRNCGNNQVLEFGSGNVLHGPSIIDLDDDGIPEIVMDEMVFAANGCIQNTESYTDYAGNIGVQSAVVDVDLDGRPDLVRYNNIAEWNTITKQWQTKPWFFQNASQKAGHVAIANAGTYSQLAGKDINELPEIVVVSAPTINAGYNTSGEIRLMALNGQTVWGPIPIYKNNESFAGRGGPPTISDFDNDGHVEFAAAGAYYFGVYDPDCGPAQPQRPGGTCDRAPEMQGLPDGVLWAQPSSDWSSNMTGSSVFDFDGDGKAEVVYRDECYARVYDGQSGEVLFSAPGFSLTGIEYPTIADVDGDFKSEIVVPRTLGNINCPSPDPLFADSGDHVKKPGFVIYRDPEDRWANSRPIWNQHSYSVTHINDDGSVVKSSEILVNWLQEGLNNFRQNIQGAFGLLDIADLTVELTDLGKLCEFGGGDKTLSAEVCNRGTAPVTDGVEVAFYETNNVDDPPPGVVVCVATTQTLLEPGDCEIVMCDAVLKGTGNIYVDVDPDDTISDCHPGNNFGADAFDICPG
ncbi:MAG: VCBS repeat-containing protein, partial [Myxococcales bacterium]|nr:VCBS repeat-containing protein [Myxococcales bacterium]